MLQGHFLTVIASGLAIGLMATVPALAAPIVFSGAGTEATTAFNDFRTAIGGGSRITWDGVRLDGTDVNPNTQVIVQGTTVAIPVDRFRNVGALFEEPYSVSGNGFASVNPATTGEFPAFSPNNTFVMFDDTAGQFDDRFIEQSFVLPNTDTPAGTRGFGAIFLDVENPTSSSIEFFGRTVDGNQVSLGTYFVPVGGSGQPEFLGVLFDQPIITDVTLTVGTNALFSFDGATVQPFGPENLGSGIDLVATDDFIFATPTQAVAVPEPATLLLLFSGFGYIVGSRCKCRRT